VVGVLALLASVLFACVAIYLLIHVGDSDVEFPLGGRGLSSIKGPAIVLFAAASIATFLLGRGTAGRRILSDVRNLRRGETGEGQRWSLFVVVVLLGGARPGPAGWDRRGWPTMSPVLVTDGNLPELRPSQSWRMSRRSPRDDL
jgi:hypothetical protein